MCSYVVRNPNSCNVLPWDFIDPYTSVSIRLLSRPHFSRSSGLSQNIHVTRMIKTTLQLESQLVWPTNSLDNSQCEILQPYKTPMLFHRGYNLFAYLSGSVTTVSLCIWMEQDSILFSPASTPLDLYSCWRLHRRNNTMLNIVAKTTKTPARISHSLSLFELERSLSVVAFW